MNSSRQIGSLNRGSCLLSSDQGSSEAAKSGDE